MSDGAINFMRYRAHKLLHRVRRSQQCCVNGTFCYRKLVIENSNSRYKAAIEFITFKEILNHQKFMVAYVVYNYFRMLPLKVTTKLKHG